MKNYTLAISILIIMVSGCAAPPPSKIKQDISARSMLLVVALDDEITYRGVGWFAWEQHSSKHTLEGINFADTVEKWFIQKYGSKYKIKVVEPERRKEFVEVKYYWSVDIPKINEQREFIRQLAEAEDVDMIMVIGSNTPNGEFMLNPQFNGNGILTGLSLTGDVKKSWILSTTRAVLFDGVTTNEIAADENSGKIEIEKPFEKPEDISSDGLKPLHGDFIEAVLGTTEELMVKMGL